MLIFEMLLKTIKTVEKCTVIQTYVSPVAKASYKDKTCATD